jgi:hypothetical protein
MKATQSQSYFTTGDLPPISSSWRQAPRDSRPEILFFRLNPCGHTPNVTSSPTRGWVCLLWIGLAFVKCTYRIYSMLLKSLSFVLTNSESNSKSVLCYDRRSVGQSILVSNPRLGPKNRFFVTESCEFVDMGRPIWREDGLCVYSCCWSSPAQSFSGPSSTGVVTILYCLIFETPPTWRVRSPYLYHLGKGRLSYTPTPCMTATRLISLLITSVRTSQKISLPRIPLFLRVYSLPRKRVCLAAT